jgi:hypothetical protein
LIYIFEQLLTIFLRFFWSEINISSRAPIKKCLAKKFPAYLTTLFLTPLLVKCNGMPWHKEGPWSPVFHLHVYKVLHFFLQFLLFYCFINLSGNYKVAIFEYKINCFMKGQQVFYYWLNKLYHFLSINWGKKWHESLQQSENFNS